MELSELSQKHMKYAQALFSDLAFCNDPDMGTNARKSLAQESINGIRDLLTEMEQRIKQ